MIAAAHTLTPPLPPHPHPLRKLPKEAPEQAATVVLADV